jgi:hypothetical protein
MPSNIITINRCRELEWIIPDSEMEKIKAVLDEAADKLQGSISSDTSSSPDLQIDCQASHWR